MHYLLMNRIFHLSFSLLNTQVRSHRDIISTCMVDVPDENPVCSFSCSPGSMMDLPATVIPTMSPSKFVFTIFISVGYTQKRTRINPIHSREKELCNFKHTILHSTIPWPVIVIHSLKNPTSTKPGFSKTCKAKTSSWTRIAEAAGALSACCTVCGFFQFTTSLTKHLHVTLSLTM